jgi:hypothetical protein
LVCPQPTTDSRQITHIKNAAILCFIVYLLLLVSLV